MSQQSSEGQAATEAAQNVVDEVTSYEYSAEDGTIEKALDEGLDKAQVQLDAAEKERIVGEIHDLRTDEDGGTPQVDSASPKA